MPYFDGSDLISLNKGKYLSMRACGFNILESCEFAGITLRTLQRYRSDDSFFAYCDSEGLSRLRCELRNDILGVEFAKNFRMILMHDAEVIKKSALHQELTPDEQEYLEKIRPYYTPQAFKQIKEVMVESTTKPSTSDTTFEELVLIIHRKSQSGENVYVDPRQTINAARRFLRSGEDNAGNEDEPLDGVYEVSEEDEASSNSQTETSIYEEYMEGKSIASREKVPIWLQT